MSRPQKVAPLAPPKKIWPKWEYLQEYSAGAFMAVELDEHGADGWELVSIYRTGDAVEAPVYYAVFKREVL